MIPRRMTDLIELRHALHRLAEPSGEEERTARLLGQELESIGVDALETQVGGHGLLCSIGEASSGPTVLFRADIDALPLRDDPALPYTSEREGAAHRCGHDGHAAMAFGLVRALVDSPPESGRVVVMFQPAEETGQGASAVLADPRFVDFEPDRVLATHNLPGYPLGSVVLCDGVFASSSRGLRVEYHGQPSHASEPDAGRSPVPAAAALALHLASVPQEATPFDEAAQVTVVGIRAGGERYGINPGFARVMATLRAHSEETMERLASRAIELSGGLAQAHGLEVVTSWHDDFPATVCDARVVSTLARTAGDLGVQTIERPRPFPWSEDFGQLTARYPGALFGLGSGLDQPHLHAKGFDFPDALLEPGVRFITSAVRALLNRASHAGSTWS